MDNRVSSGAAGPAIATLVGSAGYIKSTPACPSSGTYTVSAIGTNPVCSVGGTVGDPLAHLLP